MVPDLRPMMAKRQMLSVRNAVATSEDCDSPAGFHARSVPNHAVGPVADDVFPWY